MEDKWYLKPTNNINQMLRVRNDLDNQAIASRFKNLLIIKHNYHIADDIMFPDPACLSFFTAFEQNHLASLEQEDEIILAAVDIFEGLISFYVYCDNPQETLYKCASFLKSDLYKCDFNIILNDNSQSLTKLA